MSLMDGTKKRILVINDDISYLELMQEFLQGQDFDVRVFEEPDVTLGKIKALQPDLLIIDLIFGKEPNGWLMLQSIQIDPIMRHVPVLMCSAAVEQMRTRINDFADLKIDFLEKPFDLSVMMERILALLERPGTND